MPNRDRSKDKYNFVLYVPEITHTQYHENEKGQIVLELPADQAIRRFMAWLVKKKPVSDLTLDSLSSRVWAEIDGQKSILDIGKIMAEQTGDDREEALRRLVHLMRFLVKKRFIRFKEVKDPDTLV